MSVAALEALALRAELPAGLPNLPQRYFYAAAQALDTAWRLASSSDLRLPDVPGRRPLRMRVMNRWVGAIQRAAARDPTIALGFLRVASLVDPPTALLAPAFVVRVAAVLCRRRAVPAFPLMRAAIETPRG